ncbi:hypothetical protein ACNIUU_19220, partial [Escherichia coli]
MLPSETMIWQPEFTDKTLSRKPGAVHSLGRDFKSAPVDGVVTVRAYPLYVKQEDFSDITATAKHQFRDKYAREGYQLQKVLQLRPTSTHTMEGSTMKLFSTRDRVVVMC